MSRRPPITRSALVRTVATILATIASFLTVYAFCRLAAAQGTGPAIAAAVFSLGYGRRTTTRGTRHIVLAPAIVAFVALAAVGVGRLLIAAPPAGAAVFVIGMFLSVYARNFSEPVRQIGTVVALPLIAMLVVPATPAHAPGGPIVDIALGASAGVVSLFFAALAQAIIGKLGFAPPVVPRDERAPAQKAGLTTPTRMALQMAVALAAAFAVGFELFPEHWGWTVLTAFIVCSGARGRGDALYKGVLRLAGAIGGTVTAAIFAHIWAPSGIAEAVAIFVLLFFALLLRDINYAYWAAGSTLILALLARSADGFNLTLLGTRLEAMLVGAACAVIATWFVFPIRTEDVVRRYLADALKAFDDLVVNAHDYAERPGHAAHFDRRMTELERVAPPVTWHRRLFVRSKSSEHPASWIELARDIHGHASIVADGDVTGEVQRGKLRRAIGISRRAIGQHRDLEAEGRVPIGDALTALRDAVANAKAPPAG